MMSYSALFKIDSHDLHSEAEVETRLLAPLFESLGYPKKSIIPKKCIEPLIVQSGVKKSYVQVDFILNAATDAPRIVVEAKKPKESLSAAWGQAAGYALSFNRDRLEADRIKWLLISNGHLTSLYRHDSGLPTLTLRLSDFVSGSPVWAALRSKIKFQNADSAPSAALAFDVVTPDELNKLFSDAHQLIWKKQKLAPQDAFFEFCKFIFLKITEDKKREAGGKKEGTLFPLTTPWLTALGEAAHPVRDLLFNALRDDLEAQIKNGKKRIFDPNERLRLTADTCRELIKRFERINLSSIDEDLNGRMFEVFLNEAVRGKDLGQYFTP
ncbi:MAG: type I restriction enzyme HsdR N-terminal domain-containing protein, partial [Rectinemataceae bacterium]|nr:type I restriction enzyme HsdR N-terminal domain-containing protein [Rectinemataceae bacterium]